MEDLESSASELLLSYCYWVINYCLWSLELNNVFLTAHQPRVLRAAEPEIISHQDRFVTAQDGFLAILTGEVAEHRGMPFIPIKMRVRKRPGRIAGLKGRMCSMWSKYIDFRVAGRRSSKAGSGLILATTPAHRMGSVIDHLRKSGIKTPAYILNGKSTNPFDGSLPLSWFSEPVEKNGRPDLALNNRLEAIACAVSNEPERFSHAGISFSRLLETKIREGIAPFLLRTYHKAIAIESTLRSVKPSVVFSAGDQDEDRFTGAICRRLNIPAVMIFHGSLIVPKSPAEHAEAGEQTRGKMQSSFPYTALPSPLAEKHGEMFPSEGTPIRTGPLIWGSNVDKARSRILRRKLLGDRKARVILHASTPKSGPISRFFIYESANEYVKAVSEMSEAVTALPDTHLIVKFQPSPLISVGDIKSLVRFSDRVTLSVDEPFLDVLGFADLLVGFTSTAIEEAFLNRVPVLLYGGEGRCQYVETPVFEAGESLPVSPVYGIKGSSDLVDGLRTIFERLDYLSPDAFDRFRFRADQIEPIEDIVRRFACERDVTGNYRKPEPIPC